MGFVTQLSALGLLLLLSTTTTQAYPHQEASEAFDRIHRQQATQGSGDSPVFVADDRRGLELGQRDGFKFENPSIDCKYTSQPRMYDILNHFAQDTSFFFTMVHENVDWTIIGHHPLAGHYPTSKLFFVNTLWRLRAAFDPSRFYLRVIALHGGCNSNWAVQELDYHGYTVGGDYWQVINMWVTRWENDRIVESRAYVDAPTTMGFLHAYEIWWNSTTDVDHTKFLPGPQGMPPI
jgi:ketosteroid isomerase-like protein